ncbi:DNA polymerase III subunit delta [Stieleria varia]|uniref:DNA-directed DNA polymerase n=1 Tax=Stieleria varia TaxID=2528005 RepID=A0A5C6ARP1_9BACT|nr:DNA polymerase III subunit delta [Stieleria varia]TWU00834.1 DNA polymerase III subunit delta [Stieleria varia]
MSLKHAFDFLITPADGPVDFDVAALFGPDATLASWVAGRLIGDADVTQVDGDTARWSDIRDDLATASLFDMGEKRTIIIRGADKFLSANRPEIEAYLAKPGSAARLILLLESFPSNTKAYKMIDKSHLLIVCSCEVEKKYGVTAASRRKFLTDYVAPRHQTKLTGGAADALIEMLGADTGFIDTEIAKLALYKQPGETVDEALVRDIVSGWQGKTIWQIIEAINAGDAAEAIRQLDKLMEGGQPPIALLPQIAWSLRRLGLATAAIEHAERTGKPWRMDEALTKAGIKPFEAAKAGASLKRIGRVKARQLLPWLLDADLRLKGTHSADGRDRFLLEQFVLRLAKPPA